MAVETGSFSTLEYNPAGVMVIRGDTRLEAGRVYLAPHGIEIDGDGVTLDGNHAVLVGAGRAGAGVRVRGKRGVTVRDLRLLEYEHGVRAEDCQELTIRGCQACSTAEVPANTIFLDIWRDAAHAYGGGVLLVNCAGSRVEDCDLQHQMAGLQAFGCSRLAVRGNNASYCSGWGFLLYDTSDSLFEANTADYCCRYEPRGERKGHMGADAAGFLIVNASCRNIFRRNLARLGGDGFFLAGLATLDGVPVLRGCDDNLFEENDGSYSPNIAFEATFSRGNRYINNYANHCNYGFWLGFSRDGILENNQMEHNAAAGIAVENGIHFVVRRNTFAGNAHGVLLWSHHVALFEEIVPENDTSRGWLISGNTFTHNDKAVRIAPNQSHGVEPADLPDGYDRLTFRPPRDHTLLQNTFVDNRVDLDLLEALNTRSAANRFLKETPG